MFVCLVALCVLCDVTEGGRSWTGAPLQRWRSGNQTVTLVAKHSAVLSRGHLGSSPVTAYTHPLGNRCMHTHTHTHTHRQ